MKKQDANLAEICGAFIGDGWIDSKKTAFYILGDPKEDKEYYDFHLGPLFSKRIEKTKPKHHIYWSVYGIHSYKKSTINFFIKNKMMAGKKANKAFFPKWILSSEKLMIAALRGLYDADGNFHCKKCYGKYDNSFRKKYHCQPRIILTSTSKKLIIQSFEILKKLGFHPEKIKLRKGGLKNKRNCSKSYIIKINKLDEIKRWFEKIKLSKNPKHITKYLIWKKHGFCPPKLSQNQRKRILNGSLNPNKFYAGDRVRTCVGTKPVDGSFECFIDSSSL